MADSFLASLRKPVWAVLLLISAGTLSHAPALPGEAIWDDKLLVLGNPFIRSPIFVLEAFRHFLFLDSFSGHYRPVQNLSMMFDYFFGGTNLYIYHLTNLVLHVTAAVLLYFLARRLFRSLFAEVNDGYSYGALAVALLWIIHPVHSAAVDYVSGRADSLAFVFAAGGWLLFLRAGEAKRRATRALLFLFAGANALLALCSRETALIWVALFLLHLIAFANATWRRKAGATFCCFLLIGGYAGLRHLPPPRDSLGPSENWTLATRSALMMRALGDYGRLLVFPTNLHMERTVMNPALYQSNLEWEQNSRVEYLSMLGLGVAALLAAGCMWRGHGRRARIFGVCWFAFGFLPISNLIELNATVAEHWLYLPSVGLFIFLVGCVANLRPWHLRRFWFAGATIAVVALSVRAAARSSDWVNEEAFYRKTLATGGSSSRLAVNLARIYAARGETERAEEICRRVLGNGPSSPLGRTNLGLCLMREGKVKEAEGLLRAALDDAHTQRKDYPRTWTAAVSLILLLNQEHRTAEALQVAEQTHRAYPGTWEVIAMEANLLNESKGSAAAISVVSDFTRAHWWHYDAALALGQLYAMQGDSVKARATLHHASRLDVHDVKALDLLAILELKQNNLRAAWQAQRRAVSRQPDQPRQYVMLSSILEKMGRPAEAHAATAEAVRLAALVQTPVAAN